MMVVMIVIVAMTVVMTVLVAVAMFVVMVVIMAVAMDVIVIDMHSSNSFGVFLLLYLQVGSLSRKGECLTTLPFMFLKIPE